MVDWFDKQFIRAAIIVVVSGLCCANEQDASVDSQHYNSATGFNKVEDVTRQFPE
jgi:hypothetical protein